MTILHYSDLSEFREPLGAVCEGESVTLRIKVIDGDPTAVKLCCFGEGVENENECKLREGYWECSFTAPLRPVVLQYYFVVTYLAKGETASKTVYYGAGEAYNQGEGKLYKEKGFGGFQLTVYKKGFETPEWFSGRTMYQIFPDRFCRGNIKNLVNGAQYHESRGHRVVLHDAWDELPLYEPVGDAEFYSPCDFYGGDLQGIINQLEHLSELRVSTIYLNPVSEAESNHRYDTADYLRVDPFLGSNEDFARLCEQARSLGIKIMIDGVYSHTGSDSVYFNKRQCYDSVGAYQGEQSPYYEWYSFADDDKDSYKCWWGFDTLPEIDELNPKWQDFVITGENSVFAQWMRLGASGIRLDVADELPDETIELMRKSIKKLSKDNVLLGEVWEDATTKESYGVKRKYALGEGLDSVMNYPFRAHVIDFLLGRKNAYELAMFLKCQSLNYPRPIYYSLMNLISSHDVPRIRTILATGKDGEGMSREQQADLIVPYEDDRRGAMLQRLAVAIQFTIPGSPCIYYGDEYGMHGLKDPFNRGAFVKRDKSILEDYLTLSSVRAQEDALRSGNADFFSNAGDIFGVLRYHMDKGQQHSAFIALINRGSKQEFSIELDKLIGGMTKIEAEQWHSQGYTNAIDVITGRRFWVHDGVIKVEIGDRDYAVLRLNKR